MRLNNTVVSAVLTSILIICASATAATYYVSNLGDNARSGASQDSAWKTLTYAASRAVSGDRLLLRRGDIFREGGISIGNGREVGAYGAGNRPVVSGAVAISGWTAWTGHDGIYSAPVSTQIENLYVNGALMRIARFPNTGFLRTTTNDATSHVVTCTALTSHPRNAADYWNGCRMRWRHWNWYYDVRIVQDYAANGTLTLAGSPVQDVGNGASDWGFYLDNKLTELDTAGEWFHDAGAGRVYLYPPPGTTLSSALVEGTSLDQGLSLNTVTMRDVEVRHYKETGISIDWQCVIERCTFSGIGGDSGGVGLSHTWNASGSRIANCLFANNLNVSIGIIKNPAASTETLVESDTIRANGTVPGYGGRGSWHAAGIVQYAGNHVRIRHCRFDSTGYAAIIFGSPGNTAEYNLINHAMATLVDGAAIYTNCDSTTFRNNIILNTIGNWDGSPFLLEGGNGIWPEFLSHFKGQRILNNTCAYGRRGNGIFFPNNFNSLVKGNVCYDNACGMHAEGGFYTDDNLPLNDSIVGNVFYTLLTNRQAFSYRPEYNYGTISGNWYCNPNSDNVLAQYNAPPGNVWNAVPHPLSWWNANWSQADPQGRTDIIKRPANPGAGDLRGTSRLVYNDDTVSQTIALDNGVYLTLDSQVVSGGVTLEPYSSVVLVHTGQVSTTRNQVTGRNGPKRLRFSATAAGFSFILPEGVAVHAVIFDCRGRTIAIVARDAAADRRFECRNRTACGVYGARVELRDNNRCWTETSTVLIR